MLTITALKSIRIYGQFVTQKSDQGEESHFGLAPKNYAKLESMEAGESKDNVSVFWGIQSPLLKNLMHINLSGVFFVSYIDHKDHPEFQALVRVNQI